MSVNTDIAAAVVTLLNGGSFSQAFTSSRQWTPKFSLPELATLRVSVKPATETITKADREKDYFDVAIDVGVQRKVDSDAEIDDMDDLAEEIIDHLRNQRLSSLNAAFLSITREPILYDAHLEEHRAFTSIITVTYRVRR